MVLNVFRAESALRESPCVLPSRAPLVYVVIQFIFNTDITDRFVIFLAGKLNLILPPYLRRHKGVMQLLASHRRRYPPTCTGHSKFSRPVQGNPKSTVYTGHSKFPRPVQDTSDSNGRTVSACPSFREKKIRRMLTQTRECFVNNLS